MEAEAFALRSLQKSTIHNRHSSIRCRKKNRVALHRAKKLGRFNKRPEKLMINE
jgi:hypothetical protein